MGTHREVVPGQDPNLPDDEKPRAASYRQMIAARLRKGPATNLELGRICNRYGARLLELKRAGFLWSKTRVEPHVYRYHMVRDLLPAAADRGG